MAHREALTAKGARQAEAILDAAVRCLGRDGYSATSLQLVADEAGVQKRMVVYYFGSRQGLIEQVVRRIEERLLVQVQEAVSDVTDPEQTLKAGFDLIWEQLTSDPALQAAYVGLVAESVTDPVLAASLASLRDEFRDLLLRVVADLESKGHRLMVEPETLAILTAAAIHGLGLEFLERGATPELRRAVDLAQRVLSLAFAPAPSRVAQEV
jgi:AcrR family transcriptional regulator